MPPSSTTVVVTGANRGVGLAIVRLLATSPPVQPLHIFACARQPDKVSPKPPITPSPDVTLNWLPLDISSPSSISNLTNLLSTQSPTGIDVLINNAGINLDYTLPPGIEASTNTLSTNYDGTLAMCRAFIPLLQSPARSNASISKGRIVNISSVGSKLRSIPSQTIRQRIYNASTLDEIAVLRDEYLSAIKDGKEGKEGVEGWPARKAYGVSKALINAMTGVLARENEGVVINCCCVGWCDTDMGGLIGGRPSKTAEEGARIPINVGFGDIGGVSGKYFENESVSGKGLGKVSDWQ